jgi:hypothetical protein
MATPIAPGEEAPSKEQLIAQLKGDLAGLVTSDVRGDVDVEKTYQYAQARRNELYMRGKQYLAPVMVNSEIADYSPVGTVKYGAQQGNSGRYDHTINILRGDGRKFVAVLGQRAPNVKAMPDHSDDEVAIRRSRRADVEARKLHFDWRVDREQRHLALDLWQSTTTFAFIDWVADGQKYGYTEEPVYETEEQEVAPASFHCIQCGATTPADAMDASCATCGAPFTPDDLRPAQTTQVPKLVDVKKYPKGAVEFHLANVFTVTTPFWAKSIEDLPWLLYEYEEHRGRLMAAYPQLREKLKTDSGVNTDGGGSAAQGTFARETLASPTGVASTRKNRVLYTRVWLRPLMYEIVADDAKRKLLQDNFPDGCRLTMVNQDLVDLEADKIEDHWTYCKPDVSQTLYADPICQDFISIQDLTNDMHNLSVETFERSIPWFLFDPTILDPEQMRKHAQMPGEGVPAKAGVGKQLSDSIWKAPVADVNPQVFNWSDSLRSTGREITGILPAIFGGDGGTQTAREAELRRNQALMQLGVTWAEMRAFWARAFEIGIKLKATYGAAQEQGAHQNPTERLATLAELAEGGWHMEAEEAMPMTWGQRRDFFMLLLDKGPAAWNMFGLAHPNNLPQVQQVLGMDGWTIPFLNARDKVYDTIGQLVQGAPIQNPATGQIEPSIPVDIWEDDHTYSAQVVKEWAQSEPGRATREANPEGYSNVIAWGMGHLELTMPPPMPALPAPDGATPPNGGDKKTEQATGAEAPTPQGAPPGAEPNDLAKMNVPALAAAASAPLGPPPGT